MTKLITTREELGPDLHTALRKYCDSPQTTIAYNVIHLMIELDNDMWCDYLDSVWAVIEGKSSVIPQKVRIASKRWADKERKREWNNYIFYALGNCLKLFDSSDWYGYCALIMQDED